MWMFPKPIIGFRRQETGLSGDLWLGVGARKKKEKEEQENPIIHPPPKFQTCVQTHTTLRTLNGPAWQAWPGSRKGSPDKL